MIRRAEAKDLERIKALLQQVLTVHANGRPDVFIPGTTKYTDEELLLMFKDDTKPIFVITNDEDVAMGHAFCVFEEIKNSNNMQDMKTLYIDDICIDENYRRRHAASDIYEYVKAFAKENGCYHITLNVWELNTDAMAFYKAMGMKTLKTCMEEIL